MKNQSNKPHLQDKILEKTILKFIPNNITPNQITISRFMITPVVSFFILREFYITGMFLFLIAAITDMLDGAMARTRNKITDWGKLYDPIADKILIGSAAILLIGKILSIHLANIILVLEALFIANGWRYKKRGIILQANLWGKIKMMLQVSGILLLFLFLITGILPFIMLSWIIFISSIFFAVLSFYNYGI